METRRVELSDGNWATVRLSHQLGDQVAQIKAARDRGFESDYMDALVLLKTRIVEWSFGSVDDATVYGLSDDDGALILTAIQEATQRPNPSSPSPNGTRRTKAKNETTAANPPGNGE